MSDGYQGYKNYETYVVCRWLDNDEPLSIESGKIVRDLMDEGEDRDVNRGNASQALKAWVESMKPELDAPFGDLLSGALSEVNWYEVAETRLAE
jgi:hypothetical protein